MDTSKIGKQITNMRKERGFTQEGLAELLGISPQSVSKWENGHSLPETALLPHLAKALDTSIDSLLTESNIHILAAFYGDGMESYNVTSRLNRLMENDVLDIEVNPVSLACAINNNRPKYVIVKYQAEQGVYYLFAAENKRLVINRDAKGLTLPGKAEIVAASYGAAKMNYDVMNKIEHYRVFNWNEYRADHETFPSDPLNDDKDYLTFVYLNSEGIHMATCEEGESIACNADNTGFYRKLANLENFIPDVPTLPEFGKGWECSWAAALTAALRAMGTDTGYDHVMGVSGACYRLAFCSPGWDYSSVDGLVAYDYATPGYRAFGYSPEMHGRVEKADRAAHRERMMKEIRNNMPVLGINLRVAAEWGVICGYKENGADLYCRTKYDGPAIENDPENINGSPPSNGDNSGMYGYMQVDNWPFIIAYFTDKTIPPSDTENLLNSLKVMIDSSKQEGARNYSTGFNAYETWRSDLLDDEWYEKNDDEQYTRRFSVNQFCSLALYDARRAAFNYLNGSVSMLPGKTEAVSRIAFLFRLVSENAEQIHKMLDSGEYLEGARARAFWTKEMRHKQAELLSVMLNAERKAVTLAEGVVR